MIGETLNGKNIFIIENHDHNYLIFYENEMFELDYRPETDQNRLRRDNEIKDRLILNGANLLISALKNINY